MRVFGSPLVWLLRFRKRCGYGVHSPFAFRFVTEVCYERTPFYAYGELDATLPFAWRFRRRKGLHLLFRVANWFRPEVIALQTKNSMEPVFFKAACPRARQTDACGGRGSRRLIFLDAPNDEAVRQAGPDTLLVLDNLHRHRRWFSSLPAVVSFDLYDLGIAFFDTQYYRQHYIVNF